MDICTENTQTQNPSETITRKGFHPADNKGLAGLYNKNNTCYYNSSIQCLSNCPIFLKIITDERIFDLLKNKNESLTNQMHILIKTIWTENNIIVPATSRQVLIKYKKDFEGREQHDAQELLASLLDVMQEETIKKIDFSNFKYPEELKIFIKDINKLENNKTEYEEYVKNNITNKILYDYFRYWITYPYHSPITNIFFGMMSSTSMCPDENCKHYNVSFEPFPMINLEINKNKNSTLLECLDEYTKNEQLDKDNMSDCDKCNKKVSKQRQILFTDLPPVLIIHLKRFDGDRKNTNLIDYPINNLNMIPYLHEKYGKKYDKYKTWKNNDAPIYNLVGAIMHRGHLNGGHYYAQCLNGDNWFRYNDEDITFIGHCEDETIKNRLVNESAYILIYQTNQIYN